MTINSGTSTDYIDLLDQLLQVATSRSLASVAINAGGTGHAVGDIIDITATGSTSTHLAKLEVTSVSGGVIDGIRVYRGGAYTVDPTTTTGNAQSATTGSGISATFDLTFAETGWTQLSRNEEAVSATISAGGSGYATSDVLTLVGGVLAVGGSAATFTVDSVSSGAVTAVSLLTAGEYEVAPANAVLTTNDGSGDNACTLTVTFQDTSGDTLVVLQGDAGSAVDPLVGIRTYSNQTDETSINTVYNWAIFGMTAYSAALPLHEQVNISDGFNTAAGDGTLTSLSGDGAFVPLKNSTAFDMEWWFWVTGRRIVGVVKVETASTTYYSQFSFGLFNQYGLSSELPYPAYVAGTSDRKRVWFADTLSIWGGLSEVIEYLNGPLFAWAPEGEWINAKVATINGVQGTSPSYSVSNDDPRAVVWPLGYGATHENTEDQTWTNASGNGFDNADLLLPSSPISIYRTPNSGGDLFPLYPITVQQSDTSSDFYRVFGEIDGVFFLHDGGSGLSSEDRIELASGERYLIFQNGTRTQPYSFLAIRED